MFTRISYVIEKEGRAPQVSGIARNRSIRTGNLNPLRDFQCLPINAVFFCGSNKEF